MNALYGKYRGAVTDNQDPMQLGRIRARLLSAGLDSFETGWATPCFAFGGTGMGFFALPKIGAGVWIEFEGGQLDSPIWSGCWFSAASEMPSTSAVPGPGYRKVLFKTEGGQSLTLDDTAGIILETSGGQKIKLSSTGIEIESGGSAKLTMQNATVNVNNGALEIQ
jgi:uncharacterized protein involved in type VI secretion and phage assembly